MRCKECGDEVEVLENIEVEGRRVKVCEACVERIQEEGEISHLSRRAMSEMMGYRERH